MSDKPRFYTTSIGEDQTAHEIQKLLRDYAAKRVAVDYDDAGNPVALHFVMNVAGVGDVQVVQRPQTEGIRRRLDCDPKRARMVAWRQLKTLVGMKLEMVENEVVTFANAFLPGVMDNQGRTLSERFHQHGEQMLASSDQRSLPNATPDHTRGEGEDGE